MIRQANPSNVASVVAQAVAGDIIELAAGTYTTLPRDRSNLTYRALDWADLRMVRPGVVGHRGQGMAVRVTIPLDTSGGNVEYAGLFHDLRGFTGSSVNAGVWSNDNIRFIDGCQLARRNDGGRLIGFTLGTGTRMVNGCKVSQSRIGPVGQAGNQYDHAVYVKNTGRFEVSRNVIEAGGRYPLHLYTNGDGGNIFDNVVWGGLSGITFSGAADSSTGTSVYGTSDGNMVTGNIFGFGTGSGLYLIEAWTPSGRPTVQGNVVRGNIVTRAGGAAGLFKPGMVGVLIQDNVDQDPGFKDWRNGDWSNTSSYGPPSLNTGTPPPPPPPPPSGDPLAFLPALRTILQDQGVSIAMGRGDLAQLGTDLANVDARIGELVTSVQNIRNLVTLATVEQVAAGQVIADAEAKRGQALAVLPTP